MPIRIIQGNLFESHCQALVNPVNTVGFMGKGLAAEFKKASKPAFEEYKAQCERGELRPGVVFAYHLPTGRFILHFPTKRHWRAKSKLEDIRAGLEYLRSKLDELGISSLAMPALGCGLGGLSWEEQVYPLIQDYFGDLDMITEVYLGKGTATKDQLLGQPQLWTDNDTPQPEDADPH